MEPIQQRSETTSWKPSRRLGFWLMMPLLAGTIVLCLFAWEWRQSLKIQRVLVEGAHVVPAKQIVQLAGVPSSSPMYGMDLFAVCQRILKQPFVRSVSVNRRYPNALHVCLEERVPIASLNFGQLQYIDAEGTVLPFVQSSVRLDLPVISGIDGLQNVNTGESVAQNDEVMEAIEIIQTALSIDSATYRFVSEVNMNNGGDVILYSLDAGVPIILGRGEVGKKLLMLQTFWNNFVKTKNPDDLRYVDLRYEDQIVVKWLTDEENLEKKSAL